MPYPRSFVRAVKNEFPRTFPSGAPDPAAMTIHNLAENGMYALGKHLRAQARLDLTTKQTLDLIRASRLDLLVEILYRVVKREDLVRRWEKMCYRSMRQEQDAPEPAATETTTAE